MKKLYLNLIFVCAFLWIALSMNQLYAQGITGLTVPDYSYVSIAAASAVVSQDGVTDPGPYGNYSLEEREQAYEIFLGHGYRWWGYPGAPLMICGDFPLFNFPGFHGIVNLYPTGCINPPIGFMASFGCVITDPDNRQIWALAGAANRNGPFAPYCIPNPFGFGEICYPAPATWGNGSAYGYIRKVVVVQSTGILQEGDPVDINASLSVQGIYDGDWDAVSTGVLFLNNMSDTTWFGGFWDKEYLRWGDVSDVLGTQEILDNMLGYSVVNLNGSDNTSASVKVGDTIMMEVAFNNSIQHSNPGDNTTDDGWVGEYPSLLFSSMNFGTTASVKPLIKQYGNRLDYDLISTTTGAILEPISLDGPHLDEDRDGISDTREKGADGNDSNFDGNTDGIPDWEQANVASFLTYDGQNYVTMVVPDDVELSQLLVTGNPSPLDSPVDADFSYGFFDFSIDGLDPGDAIIVTIILHGGQTVETYYKYGMTPDNIESHWYEFMYDGESGAEINGNVITLHFVDGLRGDEDITENGTIKEPGGPSISFATDMYSVAETGEIIAYPNPASDHIILKLNNKIPANDYSLNIISFEGKIMYSDIITIIHDSAQELVIPTINLPNGVYQIIISGNNYNYNSKFIKLE